jgi:hypothetical protein
VIIAAELTGVGLKALSAPAPPGHSLPEWLIVVAWIPFTFGLAWTFNARMRDVPWMLLLVYLAWGKTVSHGFGGDLMAAAMPDR